MIPFAASASRYSEWLRALMDEGAEVPFPSVRGKEQARVEIAPGMVLSVPVSGGASILKRRDCSEVMISDHGRWQEVHLGALKAVFGKTPYFQHIYPEIENIYRKYGEGRLEDFNLTLHRLVIHWLGADDEESIESLLTMSQERRLLIKRIGEERKKEIDMNHSIFGALFRLGRESLFALL